MRALRFGIGLIACFLISRAALHAASPFVGRWDVVVNAENQNYPGWMELIEAPGGPHVRVQPRTGSVVVGHDIILNGNRLAFSFGRNLAWDLTFSRGAFSGTQRNGDRTAQLRGVLAPDLKRDPPKSWTSPETLFNDKDLTGWEPDNPATNHWVADNGILLNQEHGANLRTARQFQDFKLHIELNCPDGGNSGIYLRGRYEVQVAYEKEPDAYHSMGAIYGFLKPSVEMPRKPGQWESLDATLVGRRLTLLRDGVTIIDNEEIPGITGGALDSDEAAPGPFYIQGDHTGGMKYRNITVALPKP
jgi:Domain of Unknown Function (DUF1080)